MTTVPQTSTTTQPIAYYATFGRRAYGAHRTMTPQTKARNVAASIRQREAEGRAWTFTDYGVTPDSAQAQLVLAALAA
jgi:hypothetical protein